MNIEADGHTKGNGMAASVTRRICKALPEIIQSTDATTGERLEACRLLWKIRASATKGRPRGRAFAKKVEATDQRERIDRLISGSELIATGPFQS
jgi:hypothetical protein